MINTTTATAELIEKLYEWWCRPAERSSDFLAVDFVYDRGLGGIGGHDIVWWVEQKPAWSAVTVLGRVSNGNVGALVFEGIDGATEMRCRVCWFIEARDGKIAKVVETTAHVE